MSRTADAPQFEAWVRRIEASGLAPVAVFLLELARPLGFLAGQALLLGSPLLAGTDHRGTLHAMAAWLEDPERIDALLNQFEADAAGTGEVRE